MKIMKMLMKKSVGNQPHLPKSLFTLETLVACNAARFSRWIVDGSNTKCHDLVEKNKMAMENP